MQRLIFINVEDLPSKAQWEFAVRVGNGDTKRGDGSGITNADTDTNLGALVAIRRKAERRTAWVYLRSIKWYGDCRSLCVKRLWEAHEGHRRFAAPIEISRKIANLTTGE